MATVTLDIITRNFKDLDLSFSIHPIRKDISVHVDSYAIINSVKNLVLTNFYERPFRPNIGSSIRNLLFENTNALVGAQIERAINETIGNYEPRVNIKTVRAVPTQDENGYNVIMEFYVVNLATPITIDFYLQRIR
jgi:phage baseplate assembly protein W